jgi:uncharacterized membrane protein
VVTTTINPRLGSGSWRTLLILGSLCLNVILATYVGLQWVKAGRHQNPVFGTPARFVATVAERLPKDDADILWRVYREKEKEIAGAQVDYEHALAYTLRVLAEPELDPSALRSAIADSRDKRFRIASLVSDAFLAAMLQVSPQGRHALAEGTPIPPTR